jgi:hypothetical protein
MTAGLTPHFVVTKVVKARVLLVVVMRNLLGTDRERDTKVYRGPHINISPQYITTLRSSEAHTLGSY